MGRTAISTAGVRAASDSSIEISFPYNGRRCRERIKLQPTAANLRRAVLHRAEILEAIADGTFNYAITFPESKHAQALAKQPGDAMTVGRWLDAYFKRCANHLKTSTLRDYQTVIERQLMPQFGAMVLSELRRPVIREWCETLSCGNKRIANILSIFRAALQEAVDDEVI